MTLIWGKLWTPYLDWDEPWGQRGPLWGMGRRVGLHVPLRLRVIRLTGCVLPLNERSCFIYSRNEPLGAQPQSSRNTKYGRIGHKQNQLPHRRSNVVDIL